MLSADELRNKTQLYFDDLELQQEMTALVIGPLTTTHIFRWSAAIENWKQSILPRYLKDICLPDGWMWKVSFQHRAMIVPGDTITCWAKVTSKSTQDGLGLIGLDVGMLLQTGVETCPGKATIVLPIRGGRAVPYPFVRPKNA